MPGFGLFFRAHAASCPICICAFLLVWSLSVRFAGAGDFKQRDGSAEMVSYGLTSEIRGLDPVKAGDVPSALAISKVYEGLVQYSYLARPYRVEPCLAEALPEVSADGLTYTFRLRKGIFFQDDPCFTNSAGKGRELVAGDFVYSIKRLADLKNESNGYWTAERIKGLEDFHKASGGDKPTDYDAEVEGLKAPDRHTLRIALTGPHPQLLWILTMQYAFAVPREAVEYYGNEFVNHAVGTGPFVVKSWRRNHRIEFERNPKWAETGRTETYPRDGEPADEREGLLADAGKPIPLLNRIVQYQVGDAATSWLLFLLGNHDSSSISRENWDTVITAERALSDRLRQKKIRLYSAPTLDIYYVGFNMDDPVVGKNKKLRQALTCAFNTVAWVRFSKERVMRAVGPLPPGVAGYEGKASPYPFDLEKARSLLVEAGYPGGKDPRSGRRLELTLDLGSANSPDIRESTELMVDFMAKIDIVLKANYNTWPSFLQKLDRGNYQMCRLGWVADYPDAENFLQLFYGPNRSPGPNHSNYANPEFDALYEKIRVMQDSPERTAIYKKMADVLIEDCPWLYVDHPLSAGLHHCWVQNYKPHDFPYGMQKYHKVDNAKRRDWRTEFGGR